MKIFGNYGGVDVEKGDYLLLTYYGYEGWGVLAQGNDVKFVLDKLPEANTTQVMLVKLVNCELKEIK
jgi:hypothetical protein